MIQTLLVIGRNFRPISPFLSVFLVEEKKFTTKDIANKIIPWWLYSMLLFSLVISWIVEKMGLLSTIVTSVVSEILAYIFLLTMPKRSVMLTILIEILMAYRNSTTVVDKRYYSENDQTLSVRYSTIRKITGIMSSFISQNIYYITGSSVPSVYLTILSQMLVLLCLLIIYRKDGIPEMYAKSAKQNFSITPSLVSMILAYTGAFTLSVCFRIYIDLILIERTGEIGSHDGFIGKAIEWVSGLFYYISYSLAKGLQIFIPSIKIQNTKDANKPVHGYLEGMARVMAVFLAIPLVMHMGKTSGNIKLLMCMSWVLQISGIHALKTTKNIVGGYISYLLSFLGTNITLYLSYNGIIEEADVHILTIMSYIGGISSGSHAIIDIISRRNKLAPLARFNIYSYLGSAMFACAGILFILSEMGY